MFRSTFSILILTACLIVGPLFAEQKGGEADEISLADLQTPEEEGDLQEEAAGLLGDIEVLQNDVKILVKSVQEMEKELNNAKEKLKKISIASTPARHYLKVIKNVKPALQETAKALKEKASELKAKIISLGLIEQKLFIAKDVLGDPLTDVLSRNIKAAPSKTSE